MPPLGGREEHKRAAGNRRARNGRGLEVFFFERNKITGKIYNNRKWKHKQLFHSGCSNSNLIYL
jgi:hypothetical protein